VLRKEAIAPSTALLLATVSVSMFQWVARAGDAGTPSAASNQGAASNQDPSVKLLDETTAAAYQRNHGEDKLRAWRRQVPKVSAVTIRSSADGKQQHALWYDSGASQRRPLLVVLHSWSADYRQNLAIPFARFAIDNDWVFIHPDFRGPNMKPEAAASDVAVQDVLDAVAFARDRTAVDEERIYLVGYSGGAMKALVMAGRHPELWAAVAAWGAVYDMADWYPRHQGKNRHYQGEIAASCGGVPRPGSQAEAECRARSPASQLTAAAGRVSILIAHGLGDKTVPPSHALRAFDAVAAPQDRFTDEQRRFIDERGALPPDLERLAPSSHPLFSAAGLPVRLERRSREVTLVLYDGQHDLAYNPTLRWLSAQRRR
jgi:dipeptidyl aminopeptidase/acylaminoacyl peptidase